VFKSVENDPIGTACILSAANRLHPRGCEFLLGVGKSPRIHKKEIVSRRLPFLKGYGAQRD